MPKARHCVYSDRRMCNTYTKTNRAAGSQSSGVAHPERALPSPASAVGAKVDGRGRTVALRPSPPPPLRSSAAVADLGRPAAADPTRNSEATPRATPPNASATLERSVTRSIATRPCLLRMPLPGLNLVEPAAPPLLVFRLTKQLACEKYGIAWSMSGRGERDLQVWRPRPTRVEC